MPLLWYPWWTGPDQPGWASTNFVNQKINSNYLNLSRGLCAFTLDDACIVVEHECWKLVVLNFIRRNSYTENFFIRRNVRARNYLYCEIAYGETSLRRNLLAAKFPYSNTSLRRNFLRQTSHGEDSYDEISGHDFIVYPSQFYHYQTWPCTIFHVPILDIVVFIRYFIFHIFYIRFPVFIHVSLGCILEHLVWPEMFNLVETSWLFMYQYSFRTINRATFWLMENRETNWIHVVTFLKSIATFNAIMWIC